jgi:proline dehydrogenase
MISRAALLYLSQKTELKDFFSKLPGFGQVTRRFIAGENIDDAIAAILELNRAGMSATFDHLGESTTSRAEADSDVREYLRVLDHIEDAGVNSNVSVKLTQLGLDIDEDYCLRNARRIVEAAKRHNNFVRIDMEDSSKMCCRRTFTAPRRTSTTRWLWARASVCARAPTRSPKMWLFPISAMLMRTSFG